MKLLCCGKLLGICKWASFSFQQAIGVSRFTQLLSFGKLLGDLRQAFGDLQVGIVFFPASYWCFAIYATFEFWQAIGDLQCTKLLCCGKLLGICKWALFFFPASYWGFAIYETFEFWQAIGDLQGERPPEARPFRQANGGFGIYANPTQF